MPATFCSRIQSQPNPHRLCVTDAHNSTPEITDGDLLHAGDLTQHGSKENSSANSNGCQPSHTLTRSLSQGTMILPSIQIS